jgi:hypothetical protein
MAVPPAAMMARLNADLSNIVPETVKTERTFLNQSPENRTSLFAHVEPARDNPCRFPAAAASPALGGHLRKSSRSTAILSL